MDFNPGTSGTIEATTLENQFYTLARHIHDVQRDTTGKNPQEADILDSSVNEDALTCTGTVNCYVQVSQASGTTSLSYPDPYNNAGWTEGTSGDGNATNFNHALAERAMMLILEERKPAQQVTDLRFTDPAIELLDEPLTVPVAHNARLSITFTIDLESVPSATGSQYKAKEYLA